MLDIKRIRNDFDQIAEKLARRGVDEKTLHDLKELDFKRRQLLIKSEEAKACLLYTSEKYSILVKENGIDFYDCCAITHKIV